LTLRVQVAGGSANDFTVDVLRKGCLFCSTCAGCRSGSADDSSTHTHANFSLLHRTALPDILQTREDLETATLRELAVTLDIANGGDMGVLIRGTKPNRTVFEPIAMRNALSKPANAGNAVRSWWRCARRCAKWRASQYTSWVGQTRGRSAWWLRRRLAAVDEDAAAGLEKLLMVKPASGTGERMASLRIVEAGCGRSGVVGF
jgi:hypothetical protein